MALRLLQKGPHSKREALLMLDLDPDQEYVEQSSNTKVVKMVMRLSAFQVQ